MYRLGFLYAYLYTTYYNNCYLLFNKLESIVFIFTFNNYCYLYFFVKFVIIIYHLLINCYVLWLIFFSIESVILKTSQNN